LRGAFVPNWPELALEAQDTVLNPAGPMDPPKGPGSEGHNQVLVTIPVHNEVTRLAAALEALDRVFRPTGLDYSLSIAEDGSTDGTKELLRELSESWPGILIQEAADPLGRGRALRQLWSTTTADVYCFTDADLAAGPDILVTAVERVVNGTPIVVGSRYATGACTIRPPVRSFVARAYNRLLRFSFGETLQDHQCGLKAFSSDAIRQLLPRTKEDSWFWDTEILILALKAGFPVVELPTTWIENKRHRTQVRRLLSDLVIHGTGLMRLKSRVRNGEIAVNVPPVAHGVPAPPSSPFTYNAPSGFVRR
jgi:glycosyltransferase involved in cell wall biosynthesis